MKTFLPICLLSDPSEPIQSTLTFIKSATLPKTDLSVAKWMTDYTGYRAFESIVEKIEYRYKRE
ncbi:hypothetical protein [Maribacter sp. 2304DJ31-5]|uniref:hypothetical protein n=1 Tax=Maribacter sp. 2304DJ31-5 TaxID=3386273 RepID=UPI0039BC999C